MRVRPTLQNDQRAGDGQNRSTRVIDLDKAVDMDRFAEQMRAGDVEAFADVYELFHPHLIRFAIQFCGSKAIAEDAVQTVFFNIWLKRNEWKLTSGLRLYLYRSVRNYLLNEVRRKQVVERTQLLHLPEEILGMGLGDRIDDNSIDRANLIIRLTEAIRALPERQRSAVLLRWHDDLTTEAIGEVLGVTRQAASKLLQKAMIRLRSQLDGYDIR